MSAVLAMKPPDTGLVAWTGFALGVFLVLAIIDRLKS